MRTTITLDSDTAAAVARLQRERHVGVSAAANELIRRGLRAKVTDPAPSLPTGRLGLRVDITNVADVLDMLDRAELPD